MHAQARKTLPVLGIRLAESQSELSEGRGQADSSVLGAENAFVLHGLVRISIEDQAVCRKADRVQYRIHKTEKLLTYTYLTFTYIELLLPSLLSVSQGCIRKCRRNASAPKGCVVTERAKNTSTQIHTRNL